MIHPLEIIKALQIDSDCNEVLLIKKSITIFAWEGFALPALLSFTHGAIRNMQIRFSHK